MSEQAIRVMRPRIKRRMIIIKKSLQLRFALISFVAILIATAMVGFDIYYSIHATLLKSFELDPDFVTAIQAYNHLLVFKLIIYAAIVFIVAIFVSNKFAGPIYRFEQSCEEVGDGDLTFRVQLRKNDELLDLQDKFNFMIDSLQSKMQRIEILANESTASGDPRKAQELKEEIKRQFRVS